MRLNWRKLTDAPSALEVFRCGQVKSTRIQVAFNTCKRNAKRRGIDWLLTPVEFVSIWRDDCAICSKPFSTDGYRWEARSVDRIDPSRPYEAGNVRLICFGDNAMRSINEINSKRKTAEPFL